MKSNKNSKSLRPPISALFVIFALFYAPWEPLQSTPKAIIMKFDPNFFFGKARSFKVVMSCHLRFKTSKCEPSKKMEKQYVPFFSLESLKFLGLTIFWDLNSKKRWTFYITEIENSLQLSSVTLEGFFPECCKSEMFWERLTATKLHRNVFLGISHFMRFPRTISNLVKIGESLFNYCSDFKKKDWRNLMKILQKFSYHCLLMKPLCFEKTCSTVAKFFAHELTSLKSVL